MNPDYLERFTREYFEQLKERNRKKWKSDKFYARFIGKGRK